MFINLYTFTNPTEETYVKTSYSHMCTIDKLLTAHGSEIISYKVYTKEPCEPLNRHHIQLQQTTVQK